MQRFLKSMVETKGSRLPLFKLRGETVYIETQCYSGPPAVSLTIGDSIQNPFGFGGPSPAILLDNPEHLRTLITALEAAHFWMVTEKKEETT